MTTQIDVEDLHLHLGSRGRVWVGEVNPAENYDGLASTGFRYRPLPGTIPERHRRGT